MRPGLVFILLFAALIAVYAGLADTLGPTLTYVLQGVIVVIALAAALWLRRRTSRSRDQAAGDEAEAGPDSAPSNELHEESPAGNDTDPRDRGDQP